MRVMLLFLALTLVISGCESTQSDATMMDYVSSNPFIGTWRLVTWEWGDGRTHEVLNLNWEELTFLPDGTYYWVSSIDDYDSRGRYTGHSASTEYGTYTYDDTALTMTQYRPPDSGAFTPTFSLLYQIEGDLLTTTTIKNSPGAAHWVRVYRKKTIYSVMVEE